MSNFPFWSPILGLAKARVLDTNYFSWQYGNWYRTERTLENWAITLFWLLTCDGETGLCACDIPSYGMVEIRADWCLHMQQNTLVDFLLNEFVFTLYVLPQRLKGRGVDMLLGRQVFFIYVTQVSLYKILVWSRFIVLQNVESVKKLISQKLFHK